MTLDFIYSQKKLRSWWINPHIVVKVFPQRTIKMKDPIKDHVFKVNRNRFKHFLEMPSKGDVEYIFFTEPLSFG